MTEGKSVSGSQIYKKTKIILEKQFFQTSQDTKRQNCVVRRLIVRKLHFENERSRFRIGFFQGIEKRTSPKQINYL